MKLLLPLMTPKARTVLNRLSLVGLDNYDKVKQHLLKEFKLTPREYRAKFVDAKKTAEETYSIYNVYGQTEELAELLCEESKGGQGL